MKDRRYANRGQPFEEFIRFANEIYARKKIAMIEKLPTEFIPLRDRTGQVSGVKVERKSKVDFLGRYKNIPIAIEAKHTNSDTIRFDAVEFHQAAYMNSFTEQPGTIGIVLISFGLKRIFAVPWAFWGPAYEIRARRHDRTARVTISAHGVEWEVPRKFSVRADELDPSWEVPNHNTTYGLHYLARADQYITQPQK